MLPLVCARIYLDAAADLTWSKTGRREVEGEISKTQGEDERFSFDLVIFAIKAATLSIDGELQGLEYSFGGLVAVEGRRTAVCLVFEIHGVEGCGERREKGMQALEGGSLTEAKL
jgi:hypothetical protein